MKLHAYANEDGLINNDQSAHFINRAGRRHYFNGFLKPTESGPNGISETAPKSSRFYSLSRSHREYIESQSQ